MHRRQAAYFLAFLGFLAGTIALLVNLSTPQKPEVTESAVEPSAEPPIAQEAEVEDTFRIEDRLDIPRRRAWDTLPPSLQQKAQAIITAGTSLLDAMEQPDDDQNDAELAARILDLYLRAVKPAHGYPTGTHKEIMRVLRGNNAWGLPFIPDAHPRFDSQGRLIDDWGQPFFFHAESSQHLEILSAGPDKELWTDDDIKASAMALSTP